MTPSSRRKKILFVGASGAVASRIIPFLAETYDVVGISRKRDDMKTHCVDFYIGDLLTEHEHLFITIFALHAFDAIVWNAVRYFPQEVLRASRETLHTEFDLGVALPLECLRTALEYRSLSGSEKLIFVCMTSGLAFGVKPSWGSYSIVKRGQVILAEYLAQESCEHVSARAIALGAVPDTPDSILQDVIAQALESSDDTKVLYTVTGRGAECKII